MAEMVRLGLLAAVKINRTDFPPMAKPLQKISYDVSNVILKELQRNYSVAYLLHFDLRLTIEPI